MKLNLTVNKARWTQTAIISGLLSVCTHSYLFFHYYSARFNLSGEKSFCSINQLFDCDIASLSSFSSLFSVPLALWGLLLNLFFVILVGVASSNWSLSTERLWRFSYFTSLFIGVVSLIMGGLSLHYLTSYCLLCLTAYVLSLVQWFALHHLVWKQGLFAEGLLNLFKEDLKSLLSTNRWVTGLLVGFFPLGLIVDWMIRDQLNLSMVPILTTETINSWKLEPVHAFSMDKGLTHPPLSSSQKSPIMDVVEFIDPLCPHCKISFRPIHAFVRSHEEDVRYALKFFPLDGTCNKGVDFKGDGVRCTLSYFVHCAQNLSSLGWEALDWVFDHQEALSHATPDPSFFLRAAKEIGLKIEANPLKACLEGEETHSSIQSQAAEGAEAKITGTPTVFVNGKKLSKGLFYPIFPALHEELSKQHP